MRHFRESILLSITTQTCGVCDTYKKHKKGEPNHQCVSSSTCLGHGSKNSEANSGMVHECTKKPSYLKDLRRDQLNTLQQNHCGETKRSHLWWPNSRKCPSLERLQHMVPTIFWAGNFTCLTFWRLSVWRARSKWQGCEKWHEENIVSDSGKPFVTCLTCVDLQKEKQQSWAHGCDEMTRPTVNTLPNARILTTRCRTRVTMRAKVG